MLETFNTFQPLPLGSVKLLPGGLVQRAGLNRRYMLSLATENLLQNHYMEAGLWMPRDLPLEAHGGWESPTCQLRGHFLGHWLSAAAHAWANTGDAELKGKADYIISELARCQAENGGEWVFSIPSTYLDWVARGKRVWAPHYTIHKTLMGLVDMAMVGGNAQALEILARAAKWFSRWTAQFTRDQMDDILDVETGGMLEVWANLYGITGEAEHRELMERYDRPRLFNRLLAGEDALVNKHANTTIPEVHGAARAWEVTGEKRWREIVEAYWDFAVTRRGMYATGGQTNGEVWSPMKALAARLGHQTQEHCVVYNMMRLVEMLFRWTGDPAYADYWERNAVNGILAQQHPRTGMVAYFLPMRSGSVKQWGTPKRDFWCCHGTLVQAHTIHPEAIYYSDSTGLVVAQWIPSEVDGGHGVKLAIKEDARIKQDHRPCSRAYNLSVDCKEPRSFTLRLRIPWWVQGQARILLNGQSMEIRAVPGSFVRLERVWHHDTLSVEFPKALTMEVLPDAPDTVAFLDGPTVLAGLYPPTGTNGNSILEERSLVGAEVEAILQPDNEREWGEWRSGYRTQGQPVNMRFVPLHEVEEERYGIYFKVVKPVTQ